MTWSLTGTGSTGRIGFLSSGKDGLSSFLAAAAALPRELGARLDEREVLDATELDRARRGVDRLGVEAAGMVRDNESGGQFGVGNAVCDAQSREGVIGRVDSKEKDGTCID